MRIGYDAKRLYNNFTGLGNYSRFIVDAIHQNFPDEEVFLFTPKIKDHPEVKPYLSDTLLNTIVPSTSITQLKLGSYWRSFLLKGQAEKHKLDLFHGLSHELPQGISSVTKSIVTIHDLIFLRYPQFYNTIDRWIYARKVKYACKQADIVIAISEQTKLDLIDYLGVPSQKVKVVHQGCHQNFKRDISNSEMELVRKKYNLPQAFLLNVGTIEQRKNVLSIVKALHALGNTCDIPLVIVGRPTSYMKAVQDFVKANHLENRIVYIYKAAFTDLPAIYRLATAFVYPSLFEGFGIPLVEAISCGTPVITSKGSCFSEAAGPGSLYVDPNNIEEMTKAIQKVVGDSTLRSEMVNESKEYIKRFEPPVIAEEMMDVYKSVVQ